VHMTDEEINLPKMNMDLILCRQQSQRRNDLTSSSTESIADARDSKNRATHTLLYNEIYNDIGDSSTEGRRLSHVCF
jgi:hypothetical protein